MAVYDRWWKTGRQPDGTRKRVHSADFGCEKRWQVRWRDEQGRQRTQAFAKKAERLMWEGAKKLTLRRLP